jgi:hypothetical protein
MSIALEHFCLTVLLTMMPVAMELSVWMGVGVVVDD